MMRAGDVVKPNRVITVRHGSKVGNLLFDSTDGVAFQAAESNSACTSACFLPCSSSNSWSFPIKQLVGATVHPTRHSAVQLWSCKPKTSTAGQLDKVKYTLCKSGWFECSNPDEAQQLVHGVQQAASWGGNAAPPKVMIIVNPASGRGNGVSVLNTQVLPLLRDAAGMTVDVHITQAPGHASQITRDLQLKDVDMLLLQGGDGTFYEGLQGLMQRPDWEAACTIPLCAVPAGSGNGLAASFGLWDPVTSAYSVCKRATQPLDMASVLQPPNTRHYMVLSVAYGLMANLDIGTEHLRWMGELRFSYGGLKGILGGQSWPVRTALFHADDHQAHDAHGTLSAGSKGASEGHSSGAARPPGLQTPFLRDDHDMSAALLAGRSSSGGTDTTTTCTVTFPSNTATTGLAGGAGGVGSVAAEQAGGGEGRPGAGPTHLLSDYPTGPALPFLGRFGPSLPLSLPQSDDQLPPGWTMLPEQVCNQMQYFMLLNTTHLALGANMNPRGCCADGVFELMHVSGQHSVAGKLNGLKILTGIEDGSLVDVECMKSHRVRAVVIQPCAGDTTWLVVDGEQVPRDKPLFIEVHPRLLTALVSPSLPGVTAV